MLLSIAYFPPVSYFALMAKGCRDGEPVVIEACEHYQKQSWRNRCRIYAADGPQFLNFPVVHENGTHELAISEIKVDYKTPWLIRTQRAITSAYESSAFLEYYQDELFAILDSRPETLFDLDLRLIRFFLRKIGIPDTLQFTSEYEVHPSDAGADYRNLIHPKRKDSVLNDLGLEKPYFQVFARKHGFVSNLSIMDLLFNEGPESVSFLLP